MIRNKLLSDIFYGTELEKIASGTQSIRKILLNSDPSFERVDWSQIEEIVKNYFQQRLKGQFGGPITAGDAFFMAAYMAAFRPASIIEVGIASGISSSFMLFAAEKLELLSHHRIFLHSVDLFLKHPKFNTEIGRVVWMNFPNLQQYWKAYLGETLADVAINRRDEIVSNDGPTLAFIDANHLHPWPLVDLVAASTLVPSGSWVMLQDTQVMERWLANCVEQKVPCPRPCRGVNFVSTLWPGKKIIGTEMCFNMASVQLDQSDEGLEEFVRTCMSYPSEAGPRQLAQVKNYLEQFGTTALDRTGQERVRE